jgi:hypothetical protein
VICQLQSDSPAYSCTCPLLSDCSISLGVATGVDHAQAPFTRRRERVVESSLKLFFESRNGVAGLNLDISAIRAQLLGWRFERVWKVASM